MLSMFIWDGSKYVDEKFQETYSSDEIIFATIVIFGNILACWQEHISPTHSRM